MKNYSKKAMTTITNCILVVGLIFLIGCGDNKKKD